MTAPRGTRSLQRWHMNAGLCNVPGAAEKQPRVLSACGAARHATQQADGTWFLGRNLSRPGPRRNY